MRIVLDANATIEIVLNRPNSDRLRETVEEAEEVLAPDLLLAEIVNAIWKCHHFAKLDVNVCDRALDDAVSLVDTFVPAREIHREAFALSRATNKPAYDMFYLALAQREDAVLLTLDQSLKKEAVRRGIRVA